MVKSFSGGIRSELASCPWCAFKFVLGTIEGTLREETFQTVRSNTTSQFDQQLTNCIEALPFEITSKVPLKEDSKYISRPLFLTKNCDFKIIQDPGHPGH